MTRKFTVINKDDVFGHLAFTGKYVKIDGRKLGVFLCDCGNFTNQRCDSVVKLKLTSCGCRCTALKSKWEEKRNIYGEDYPFYIIHKKFKSRAKNANVEFILTYLDIKNLWIKQQGKCRYSNLELSLPNSFSEWLKPEIMSIDRINPHIGYTVENTQIVSKEINMMKNIFTEENFINKCRLVSERFNHE